MRRKINNFLFSVCFFCDFFCFGKFFEKTLSYFLTLPLLRRYSPWKGEKAEPSWARACPPLQGDEKNDSFSEGLETKSTQKRTHRVRPFLLKR